MKKEIYISTDIETDGPIPGEYSMLSLGAAAFYKDSKEPVSTFSVNIKELENAKQDPDTMRWWSTQEKAWHDCRLNLQDPFIALKQYVDWIDSLNEKPVFVGYPAGFDFTFVYWYLIKFVGRSPFSFGALDIKSYAMALLNTNYRETVKRNMPKEWFNLNIKHSHIAVEDAVEQGYLFLNILNWNK